MLGWSKSPIDPSRWVCLTCYTKPLQTGEAQQHEGSRGHVERRREIDEQQRIQALRHSSPLADPDPCCASSPEYLDDADQEPPSIPSPSDVLLSSPEIPFHSMPPASHYAQLSSPIQPPSPILPSSPMSYSSHLSENVPNFDLRSTARQRQDSFQPTFDPDPYVLRGPKLPEDPAYVRYDDWGEENEELSDMYSDDPVVGFNGSMLLEPSEEMAAPSPRTLVDRFIETSGLAAAMAADQSHNVGSDTKLAVGIDPKDWAPWDAKIVSTPSQCLLL